MLLLEHIWTFLSGLASWLAIFGQPASHLAGLWPSGSQIFLVQPFIGDGFYVKKSYVLAYSLLADPFGDDLSLFLGVITHPDPECQIGLGIELC